MVQFELMRAGRDHIRRVDHNIVAWGAIKEIIRINGGSASEDQIASVLKWGGQPDPSLDPNTGYLAYAERNGWLVRV